jgi:uncharacterized membrane protein
MRGSYMSKPNRTKVLVFAAVMAALTNILSLDFFVIPIIIGPFASRIHISQLAILVSGTFAGPLSGLITGTIGGIYMSYSVSIPFVIGGLALLGFSAGLFSKKLKLRPFLSSILAWCIQMPYVLVTDYVWFVFSSLMPPQVALTVITTILINLTVEAIIASILAEIIVHYLKRTEFTIG